MLIIGINRYQLASILKCDFEIMKKIDSNLDDLEIYSNQSIYNLKKIYKYIFIACKIVEFVQFHHFQKVELF